MSFAIFLRSLFEGSTASMQAKEAMELRPRGAVPRGALVIRRRPGMSVQVMDCEACAIAPHSTTVLVVSLRNSSEAATPPLLITYTGEYFLELSMGVDPVAPSEVKKVRIVLVHGERGSVKTLPEQVAFDVYDRTTASETPLLSFTAVLKMRHFLGTLRSLAPPASLDTDWLRILYFGQQGAGKSSLLQSQLTLMSASDDVITGRVAVGGDPQHVSVALQRLQVEDSNLEFIDTWGVTPRNYMNSFLERLLKGDVPLNITMETADRADLPDGSAHASTRHKRAVHAVVFCVSLSTLDMPNEGERYKPLFQRFKAVGLNPFVMLCRLDEATPELRRDPLAPAVAPAVAEYQLRAAKLFGIPPNHVLFTINYTDEEQRVFAIDRLLYANLLRIVTAARERCQRLAQEQAQLNGRAGETGGQDWAEGPQRAAAKKDAA